MFSFSFLVATLTQIHLIPASDATLFRYLWFHVISSEHLVGAIFRIRILLYSIESVGTCYSAYEGPSTRSNLSFEPDRLV